MDFEKMNFNEPQDYKTLLDVVVYNSKKQLEEKKPHDPGRTIDIFLSHMGLFKLNKAQRGVVEAFSKETYEGIRLEEQAEREFQERIEPNKKYVYPASVLVGSAAGTGAYVLAALGHYIKVLSQEEMEKMAKKAGSDILGSVEAKVMEELYQAALDNGFRISRDNQTMLIGEHSPTHIMMQRYIKNPDLLKVDAK